MFIRIATDRNYQVLEAYSHTETYRLDYGYYSVYEKSNFFTIEEIKKSHTLKRFATLYRRPT